MSETSSNRTFFIRFGIVVVGLHAIIGALVFVAHGVGEQPQDPEIERALIRERVRPVAHVVTSEGELVRQLRAEDPPPNAEVAALSGNDVVEQFCASCHATGLLEAPLIGDAAIWQAREEAAGGAEGLLQSAIHGLNQMPPRGGAPQLSDEQLQAAIEAMRE